MSIFGNAPVSNDTNIAPVYEGYGVEVNGDLLALQESADDHLAIIESMHEIDMHEIALRTDMAAMKENGASEEEIAERNEQFETVTEASIKDAWARIKEYLNGLIGKLKAFFASVIRHFDGLVKSGAKFVSKYEGQLKKLKLGGFKYTMYQYGNIDNSDFAKFDPIAQVDDMLSTAKNIGVSSKADDVEKLRGVVADARAGRDDKLDATRGKLVGKSSLNASQYAEELFSAFRSGATSKKDQKEIAVDINAIITAIKNTNGATECKKLVAATDKEYGRLMTTIKQLEGKLKSASADESGNVSVKDGDKQFVRPAAITSVVIESLRVSVSLYSAQKDIVLTAFRAWKSAYDERSRVYKSVCLAAFRYKEKKAASN